MKIGSTDLYIKDAKGSIRVWSISVEDNTIKMEYGQLGGSMLEKTEVVEEGLQGRSVDDQIRLRVASRISKQLDKGYKQDIMKIGDKPVNRLGFKKPMLAKPLKNVSAIDFRDAFIQHKYDGHRCMITKQDDRIVAYTRNGKVITSIDHILEGVNIAEGMTLDGELYCHGESLQKITSWIKLKQNGTEKLKYHLYDVMMDSPYKTRLQVINELETEFIIPVPTHKVDNHDDVQRHFEISRAEGYEGSIIRWGNIGYKDGKRPMHLVKVKGAFDTECMVLDIHESKDGWAILECLYKGNTFRVSAPGDMAQKYEVAVNRENYLGEYVQVKYANLTEDGIPFHPVADKWMKDVSV